MVANRFTDIMYVQKPPIKGSLRKGQSPNKKHILFDFVDVKVALLPSSTTILSPLQPSPLPATPPPSSPLPGDEPPNPLPVETDTSKVLSRQERRRWERRKKKARCEQERTFSENRSQYS